MQLADIAPPPVSHTWSLILAHTLNGLQWDIGYEQLKQLLKTFFGVI